jgi:hypothetical protein
VQREWNGEAERMRRLEVDHQLELLRRYFCRMMLLLDRRARLLSRAAEVAGGIAKQIRPDIWIGISAQNDSAGPPAGGPTDNISFRRIAWHGCYARRRVWVSLLNIRALPVRLPSIGR